MLKIPTHICSRKRRETLAGAKKSPCAELRTKVLVPPNDTELPEVSRRRGEPPEGRRKLKLRVKREEIPKAGSYPVIQNECIRDPTEVITRTPRRGFFEESEF